jgi:glycosyltransferase involved in cell wall biosynthesis
MSSPRRRHRVLFLYGGNAAEQRLAELGNDAYTSQNWGVFGIRPWGAYTVLPPLMTLLRTLPQLRPSLVFAGSPRTVPLAFALQLRFKLPFVARWDGSRPLPHEDFLLKKAVALVTENGADKRVLIEKGFIPERIAVFSNWLPSAYAKLPPPRRPNEGSSFRIVTVQRTSAPDPEPLLQALFRIAHGETSPPFRYRFEGVPSLKARVEEIINRLGMTEIAQFTEADLSGGLDGAFRRGDLLLASGEGTAPLEAASFGLPTLAFETGDVVDFVRHGVNGMLVPAGNIGEMARTLQLLIDNRKLLFELGKKAHEVVMSEFTRDGFVKKMGAFLDGIGF